MEKSIRSITLSLRQISELEDSVRDFINTGCHQRALLETKQTWYQICSSLDVIGDTTLSLEDYLASGYPVSYGLKYIYTYGILQSLFLQQDAVRNLTEAFCVPYHSGEKLKKIREIRNSSIGHPTKQTLNREIHYNYISRISLHKKGFTLMRSSPSNDAQFIDVDIIDIIDEQTKEIQKALLALSEKLKEDDRMHREKFNQSLQDILHPATGYLFEKVAQGIHSPDTDNESFGLAMLVSIEEMYRKFETALAERGELSDYTRYDLDEYMHAISVLKTHLSSRSQKLDERDARIYNFYLRQQHDHFVEIAREIDGDYGKA